MASTFRASAITRTYGHPVDAGCAVEVEGHGAPAASCGLACEDGMVVRTRSEQLTTMRRDIIDLFVSEHPLTA